MPVVGAAFLLAVGLCLAPRYCLARDGEFSSKPMSFNLKIDDFRNFGLDLFQIINADGIIVPGTADRLRELAKERGLIPGGTIYLNSAGGSLLEGMKLGGCPEPC